MRMLTGGAVKLCLRSVLKFLGKSDRKAAAVFGLTPASCQAAVVHLRQGAPEIPIWLFATREPLEETRKLCAEVHVHGSGLELWLRAERRLWGRWVSISAATWTGEHGRWLVKLAPFLIPPFRVVVLNRHGDFFPGTPGMVLAYARRTVRDAAHRGWNRTKDIGRGCWMLVSYHIWRSGPWTRIKDVSRGLTLLVVSRLLRWCADPGRRLFRRVHGDQRLALGKVPAGGDGFVRFRQTGWHWDGPRMEALVLSTDARWILWHEGEMGDAPDDLEPLFEDERTFVVGRQRHFRAWKPLLFPTAPFRTLQAGEASQVLAPISGTMLVDRRKLLALGIPPCSLAGTAWMLLFWKAAAAGWRSYCVGTGKAARREPDGPAQETAFLSHVFTDAGLRRLGPREPDLARGSIAFARRPRHAERPRGMKVLVVSPFLPYPLSHGGAVRIYNLCRALAPRVDFTLVAVRETNEAVDYERLHEVFREVRVVDLDEPAAKDGRLPWQVREHQSRSMRALIAEVCRTTGPDLVQVEYTHMAAFRESARAPAILVEHDLTFSLYRQLAERNARMRGEYERWLEFERRWLRAYDGVWTVSEEDRRVAIGEGSDSERTYTVPNGVDISRFVPGDDADAGEIFYVGSFRHLPNILGFVKLRREVMPRLWKRFPELRLRVVAGPDHERFWRAFAKMEPQEAPDRRIVVHGFVEDLRPLYAKASVVVAPLEVSAGTNIKVLEAMACGKAMVTTPAGCAGLGLEDGCDALIRADGADFSDAVGRLLSDAALRRRIAGQARQTAERRFSWAAIAQDAYQSYQAVAFGAPAKAEAAAAGAKHLAQHL